MMNAKKYEKLSKCPYCDTLNEPCIYHTTAYSWIECKTCGSLTTCNPPIALELEEYYQNYNDNYKGGDGRGGLDRWARKYFIELKKRISTGTLLDIGSSVSPFPIIASRNHFEVTVLDYTKPLGLPDSIDFIKGNLNDCEIINRIKTKYDAVCCFAVLEHLLDVNLACKIYAHLCKSSGWIIITTTEIGCFMSRFAIGRTRWYHPPDHLNLISKRELVSCQVSKVG
jgi:transcription elongation factor Elf1